MNSSKEDVKRSDIATKWARWIVAIFGIGLISIFAVWFFSERDPIQAAIKGDYDVVASAIKNDPDIVNRPIDGGWTLLYAAAYGDQPEIIEFLIESGADPDLPIGGPHGDATTRALHTATDQMILKMSLFARPHPSPMRPVHAAAEEGNARAMKALAEGGANLQLPGGLFSELPIMVAAKKGHAEVVRVLLDAGVDPNTRVVSDSPNDPDTHFVDTTLEVAARNGHAEVVKLLLEQGAAVIHIRDDELGTELHSFCDHAPDISDDEYQPWLRSMPRIVDMLVEKLGDVNFRTCGFGNTALHVTMWYDNDNPGKLAIARHLVEHYPDLNVNPANCLRETPLHNAVSARNVAGVRFLLENCPRLKVNATEKMSGHTPLKAAEERLKNIAYMGFLDEDKKKHHKQEMKQIIELLKAHGGRVDREAELRALIRRPK